jgi:addiction module HigA family antidote
MICGLDPIHPGEILRSDVIEASGMSVTEFAKKLGVSRTAISLVLNERAEISIDMALRLSQVLGTSAEV